MILIYSSIKEDQNKIDKTIEILKERLSIFFVETNDFIYTTETNQKLLRNSILNNNIILVYVD